jgi:hypothetical protein
MKHLLFLAFILFAVNSQAQLLKKLKDKAQAVIDPKSSSSTTNAPTESNSGNSNSTKSKVKDNWTPSSSDQKVASLDEGETNENNCYGWED